MRAGVGIYYSNDIHGVPPVMLQSVRGCAHATGPDVRLRRRACLPASSVSCRGRAKCEPVRHACPVHAAADPPADAVLAAGIRKPKPTLRHIYGRGQVSRLPMVYEVNVFLTNRYLPIPAVLPSERLLVEQKGAAGFYHDIARSAAPARLPSRAPARRRGRGAPQPRRPGASDSRPATTAGRMRRPDAAAVLVACA